METMIIDPRALGDRESRSPSPPRDGKRSLPQLSYSPDALLYPQKRAKIQNKWALAPVDQSKIDQSKIEEMGEHLPVYFWDDNADFRGLPKDKEFFLLPSDSECDLYQRLIVNNSSIHGNNFSITWSRDLATDEQYVQFYEILDPLISNKVPSWLQCLEDETLYGLDWLPNKMNLKTYEAIAFDLAEELCATYLDIKDVYHCIRDIILEKYLIKPCLQLSKEFHLYLLDSGYDMEYPEKILSWRKAVSWKKEETLPFARTVEIENYERWLSQPHIRSMGKDKKREELEKFHDDNSEVDSSIRIRYLKLKLKLAEKIGLIYNCSS